MGVGFAVGTGVGLAVGMGVGFAVGTGVGFAVGIGVGLTVVAGVGLALVTGVDVAVGLGVVCFAGAGLTIDAGELVSGLASLVRVGKVEIVEDEVPIEFIGDSFNAGSEVVDDGKLSKRIFSVGKLSESVSEYSFSLMMLVAFIFLLDIRFSTTENPTTPKMLTMITIDVVKIAIEAVKIVFIVVIPFLKLVKNFFYRS